MSAWDLADTIAVACGLIWLTWFWYKTSTTILDRRYPRELRIPAYLRLLRGCLLFLAPLFFCWSSSTSLRASPRARGGSAFLHDFTVPPSRRLQPVYPAPGWPRAGSI